MGYTHYWYREREIDPEIYEKIVGDFSRLLPLFKVLDARLADGFGEGAPELTKDAVRFNGISDCGHPKNNKISIPWPSDNSTFGTAPSSGGAVCGSWFAGVTLNQRTCDGDCSYETFAFPRILEDYPSGRERKPVIYEDERIGKYFDCCKTAFRPYDLAVNVFLIITKHYLGNAIVVSSDGEMQHWMDGAKICQNAFGYGLGDFKLD